MGAKAKRLPVLDSAGHKIPNIYRYPDGQYEAMARVAGCAPVVKRFGPNTSLEHVQAWLAGQLQDLHAEREKFRSDAAAFGDDTPAERRRKVGTLEGDAPNFLSQIGGREAFKADRSHLRAWFNVVVDGERLGGLPRSAITSGHANKAITQWQTKPSAHAIRKVRVGGYARGDETIGGHVRTAPATSGTVVAARTIRHRCRVLREMYQTLDGKKAPTPIDEAKIPKRPKTPPVTVAADVIATVLAKLARLDQKTFARFAVANTCAQRPCQVERAQLDDVDLLNRLWLVRDAKGEPAHSITLDDPQVAAWEAFIVADAWGTFEGGTSRYGKIIHAAGWPKGIRPYAARHSFAVAAIRDGVSLGDLQALLGHADPKTTRIYAPFQIDRQRVVSTQMKDYLANVFKPRLVKG